MIKVTMWNYIVPIRLFLRYLGKSGKDLKIELKDYKKVPRYSALFLALGHYKYLSGKDVYDFNEGEWPSWLIHAGKPYNIYWDVQTKVNE